MQRMMEQRQRPISNPKIHTALHGAGDTEEGDSYIPVKGSHLVNGPLKEREIWIIT